MTRLATSTTLPILLVSLIYVASCASDTTTFSEHRTERVARVTAAESLPSPAPDIVFDVVHPTGFDINRATLSASESLTVGPNARILAADGSAGNVTSTGESRSTFGPSSSFGSLASVGDVDLGPRVSGSSVTSAGTIVRGPGSQITTLTAHATLTPITKRTIRVHPPKGPATDRILGPGASATLAPGRYHDVTVGPRATLALSAGTYLVDALTLGPNTTLNIDTSAGTVYLYVTGRTTLNSTVVGDARRFVLGHLGTEGATVSGSFRGTLLAPNASLTLGPQQTYEATVFAKRLTVGPGVTVKKIETPFLIGELKIAKEMLCVGEQTEVTLSTGAPTVPGVTPRIMGAIGTRQYVEFSGAPGPRTVFATLTTSDGRADHVSSPVQIQQCGAPDAASRVRLHFKGARGIPNGAELAVFQYDTNGHPVPVTPGSS